MLQVSPDKLTVVPVEAFSPAVRPMNEVQKRLQALRDFAATIPASRLDMRSISGRHGCGCVLYHNDLRGRPLETHAELFGLTVAQTDWLFDVCGSNPEQSTYPQPTGAAAKAEFLRRVDLFIELAA